MKTFFNKSIIYIKRIAMTIIMGMLFFSCAKTVVLSDLDFQKRLLAGTGSYENTKHIWKLDSVVVDSKALVLTTAQKSYTKTFTADGLYSDAESNEGKWDIAELNKLKQTIIYKSTGKSDSTIYEITTINAAELKLKYKGAKSTTEYSFKIAN
jgi:hypothetical protein